MSLVKNTDYKNILFTRSDGIYVNYIVLLNDPTNLDEDFLVLDSEDIDTSVEIDMFGWIDNKRWTLNEWIYFALNNQLCMKISDKNDVELASYGMCGGITRIHGFAYGNNYN
jgi:hypothetical protein